LYYKEVQHLLRNEHDLPLENAKRIDLDRRRQADGVMGARRRSDGDEIKRKGVWSSWRGVAPKQGQTRHGELSAFGQASGWKVGKVSPGGSGLVRKPRHRVRSAQYNVFEGRPDQIGCREQRRTEQRC